MVMTRLLAYFGSFYQRQRAIIDQISFVYSDSPLNDCKDVNLESSSLISFLSISSLNRDNQRMGKGLLQLFSTFDLKGMQAHRQIQIDGVRVNPKVIQQALVSAQQRRGEALIEVFRLLNLAQIHEANPSDRSTKEMIKSIVASQFLKQGYEESQLKPKLDLSEAFPQTKLGGFGRLLQRKCRLSEKGLLQFEEEKAPKLKQIKAFTNLIEHFNDKNKDDKIGWFSEFKKYPFRIVIIDKSDGHRAIYFTSKDKAQLARIFLSQNFRYKGNFSALASTLSNKLADQLRQNFQKKLILRHKMISQANRMTKSIVRQDPFMSRALDISHLSQHKSNHQQPNSSVYYQQVVGMAGRNTESRDNLPRINQLLQTKNKVNLSQSVLQDLQRDYTVNFLKLWREKAKAAQFRQPKGRQTSPFLVGSRISDFGSLKGSRRKGDNETIIRGVQGSIGRASDAAQLQGLMSAQSLFCYSIEFLNIESLFFKPIVTLQLIKGGKGQQSIIYNTVILRKKPHLTYELIGNSTEEGFPLTGHLRDYELSIRVIDFLANEQVVNEKLSLRTKKIGDRTILTSDNKLLKIQLGLRVNNLLQSQALMPTIVEVVPDLMVPTLPEDITTKIRKHWQKVSQSQGYYNESNLSIYRILAQIQNPPLTWWKGKEDQQLEVLTAVRNASQIFGFRFLRSLPHLISAFQQLFPDLEEMILKILSFINSLLRPYYFPQYFNRIQRVHRMMGLEQDCELIAKVNFEILVIKKILQFECAGLIDKCRRKNISFGYQLQQYIYEGFSRNLSPSSLVELWNFLYSQPDHVQLNMLLLAVALVKYYEEDLLKVKRLRDFSIILESKGVGRAQQLIRQAALLRDKYFGEAKGLVDEIKQIFNSKPLQPIIYEFYRWEGSRLDRRKKQKEVQKRQALAKVVRQVQVQLPIYQPKKYCLHIYFKRLPKTSGSLTIRCGEVNYQCLNHDKNRYFIIGEVGQKIILFFLDLKANEYSAELLFDQGVNEFTIQLTCPRSSSPLKVSYMAALLTESQLDAFKKGKKFEHFLAPYSKKQEFLEERHRPLQQAQFLRKYDSSSRDDLAKRIKLLYAAGSRSFDEIDFLIGLIQSSQLTLQQKFQLVRSQASLLAQQYTLSENCILQKHLLRLFMIKADFQLTDGQFECAYNDSLQFQFEAPKMIKCRYITDSDHKEIKLQRQAQAYLIDRAMNWMYSDFIIEDFLKMLKNAIVQQSSAYSDGQLRLLFSSNGQVFSKVWQLKIRPGKELQFEQYREQTAEELEEGQLGEPQILMTEVLPSFAKISTILDYVHSSNRPVDLKAKYQDKDRRKLAENINILKDCQMKFKKLLLLRYKSYPTKVHFPFFYYYYESTHEPTPPLLKTIYLNNLKCDLKAVCLFQGSLKFGQNAKLQSYTYKNQLGIYGNLRKLNKDAKAWFFFGYGSEQHQKNMIHAKVFTNYGFGVFRWEPCIVIGFANRVKAHKGGKNESKSKPKKEYLVKTSNQEKYVKDYQLEIKPELLNKVPQLRLNLSGQRIHEGSYYDNEEERQKQSSYKYLTKFIK